MIIAVVSLCGLLAISGCKKKETYTVTFNPNGGIGTMPAQTFTEGEAQALTRNAFTYDGHTFAGWNTVQGGSGASYTNGQSIIVTADMTLFAQWKSNGSQGGDTPTPQPSNVVTVNFNANGGTGEMAPQQFAAGTAQALTANAFTRDNYRYVNWNTSADGSGTTYTDSQVVNPSTSITLYAQWDHIYVDLGLPNGTLWATCNVGANTPEEYGDYYAWGEITTKDSYIWSTYRWCNGSENTLTKYCSSSNNGYNGFTDTLTTLEASDDAATTNWGAGWRMPTIEEMWELSNNCTHEWTTQNGVNGMKYTGPNGNSIFLPAAGCRGGSFLFDAGYYGYYWSSSLIGGSYRAYFLNVGGGGTGFGTRYTGSSVRPVCVQSKK